MGIRSADVCHGIRETFLSPFVKKHQRDESSMEGNGLAMYARGMSQHDIAAAVGCARTTVYYELRRGTPPQMGAYKQAYERAFH